MFSKVLERPPIVCALNVCEFENRTGVRLTVPVVIACVLNVCVFVYKLGTRGDVTAIA